MNKPANPKLTLAALTLTVVAVLLSQDAGAHCDALDGPVVNEARAALAAGDVTPVLKWIAPEDEATIKRVFEHVLKVRKTSDDARSLADMHFFETVVRVHRASEGAPYTGLKPAGTDPGPVVRAADAALENGSVDALVAKITEHVGEGIRQRYAEAEEARAHRNHTVEAGRKFVAAYVQFVHYVENLHNAVVGHGGPHAEKTEEGHSDHKHE